MLVARMGEAPIGPLLAVRDQGLFVTGRNTTSEPFLERHGPGRRLLAIDVELPRLWTAPPLARTSTPSRRSSCNARPIFA
jgi:hypothetical protein